MLSKPLQRIFTSGSVRTSSPACMEVERCSKRQNSSTATAAANSLVKDTADTVVLGGGIVGVCTAYHLARKGRDVLLLEKSELTAGSTWHAAGLITAYHPTPNVKRVHWESLNFYNQITAETGQEIGFHRPGSLRLGTSPIRMDEFRYALSRQCHKQSPMKLLTPEEVEELVPILNMDGIHGGLLTPNEGHIDPYSLTQAVARGARMHGAHIVQQAEVTGLQPRPDGGWDVVTPKGTVTANRVINCGGFWGREVGQLAGLDLPLVPVQHQYLVTKSVPEVQALKKEIPVLRHLDGSFYLRQERDGLLIGPYESSESMVQMEDWTRQKVTPGFGKELYPGDLERLSPHLEVAMEAFPCFANAEIQSVVNGPITYTPDILPMVGPTLLPNMWVAVGFGYGIVHGGGVGKYLSDWICEGEAPYELIEFDPLRYGKWTTVDYALTKTRESYGCNNAIGYPNEERFAGRPTNRPRHIHDKLVSAGAHMGFNAGWEVPLWYAEPGETPEYKPSFGKANWQLEQEREYNTLTQRVGVADLSPFGKFLLTGPDARKFLDRAVAGFVPKEGRTGLGHMLTSTGKVYAELTITGMEGGKYMIVTGGGSEFHDLRRLNQIAREENFNVDLENVTEEYGTLTVAGPLSGAVMERISDQDISSWKFMDAKQGKVGGVDCLGIRISYTGELGWELYPAMKDMDAVYQAIVDNGADLGLGHVGTRVINTLRIEKGFRGWGHEMNKDTSPIEPGLMPFVRMKKTANFIGKSAVTEMLKTPRDSEVVFLAIDSPDVDPEGDESVMALGKAVGYTTSGSYSPVLKSALAMASLPKTFTFPGTEVEVMLAGKARKAVVLESAPALTHAARERQTTEKEERVKASSAA
jgi:dimethylglycine dehydrogenase